ncbi:MAP kinase kinase (MEK), partial [Quaeritorhiza haematococci]
MSEPGTPSTTKRAKPKLALNTNGGRAASPGPSKEFSNEKVMEKSRLKLKDEDLQFIEELGAGSGGTVAKVLYKPTGNIMAKKIINVVVVDESERERTEKRILRELKILKICKSPYIVEFYGAFAHDGDISICMEFMDLGSLDYIYRKLGPVPEEVVAKITVPVLQGLMYLYDTHKIVHRDIKPSNILLNSKGAIKIADFGVSKELINGTMARTFTGTQGYLAPERVREGRIHSVESDVWSLGLTLMEIATARFPFPPEGAPPLPSVLDLLRYIEEEPAPCLPPGKFSPEFEAFTQR